MVITALWLRHEEDKKTFSDGKFESQLFFFFLNVPASKFSVCSVCSILEGVPSSVRHSIQSFVLISFPFVNKPAVFKASLYACLVVLCLLAHLPLARVP